ncbi:phosphatidylglycerol lysyltransferase domain-containing protein [Leptolyngbya sp. FACHB-17]|uniref:phosphatidylglycerol lysyltransferase domain-containing protein n=1 Tax=unclassified Leptolyngbya TaxID=2650499 RepID=UPI00168178E3|nr:phosphatidylglycerol lysyltransferase domain-containing protein [Leptolyngbya sp. FACHB-17]MBD2082258.1 bifunctional lysylphosphatidylglycerol flippase/synthetase MprF [Leptolyngbya sp. FACHB-17]
MQQFPPKLGWNRKRLETLDRRTRIGVWSAALLTGIMGVVNLWSAVVPSYPERTAWLKHFFPFSVRVGGHLFAALAGFILLTLAANLLRRKRVAWYVTVALLFISIFSHLIKGFDVEESVLAGVLLIQLFVLRKAYTAQSDRPSIAQGIRVLIAAIVFTMAYGTIGFYILDGYFGINGAPINFSFSESLWQTLAMFFTADNAGLEPRRRYAEFFANSIYAVGTTTLTYALFMLLRPVLLRGDPATLQDRKRAQQIIDEFGKTSLARLSLLPDKSYFFSPSGRSVIAYVAKGRAAIALGDPIGHLEDLKEAIVSFQQFCNQNDWFPTFYEVLPDTLLLYQTLGYRWAQIGEEAIIDLHTFNLKGKANQDFRTAINKLTKAGYRLQVYEPPIDDGLITRLKPVSDEWLQSKQGSEKQFSIGWFDREYLSGCHIAVVYDAHAKIIAFSNLLSGYNRKEVTVDLMRHRNDAEKGTMDFLFASLLQHFQQAGYDSFNFSLSPLAGVGETSDSLRVEKGLHYFFEHLNQFYNFKGLHQFKEKFRPRWEPRYLVYPSLTVLPDIAVGLVRADSGDRLLDYLKSDS